MSENGLSCINPRMTVLDIISRHRVTEAVFKAWDSRAGKCICCQALFDTVQQVADQHGLNLDQLMMDLNVAVMQANAPPQGLKSHASPINVRQGETKWPRTTHPPNLSV